MHFIANQGLPLPDFPEVAPFQHPEVEPFQQHISHAASHRVAHLALSCAAEDEPWDPFLLPESAVLELAEALPGLRTMAVACTTDTSELFPGLAARCPQLHKLELTLPAFSPEDLSSLAALSGLTSLDLREAEEYEEELGEEYMYEEEHPVALLLQLGALTALTNLGLLSRHWHVGNRFYPWHEKKEFDLFPVPAPPTVAHLGSLRSLELTLCTLGMDSFPWLAAALPSLERLVCDDMDNIGDVDVLEPDTWQMPNLRVIKLTSPADYLYIDNALYLAAGCPALQRLEGFQVATAVADDVYERLPARASEEGDARRWVQGLSVLAARRVAVSVLVAAAPAWAEGLCEALEELQPAELREALAGCMHHLAAGALKDPATLGRLVACLPCLSKVMHDFSQLPLLAPLGRLSVVDVSTGDHSRLSCRETPHAALTALGVFAQRRAGALGPDAAARAVKVTWLAMHADYAFRQKRVEVRVQSGVVHGLDA